MKFVPRQTIHPPQTAAARHILQTPAMRRVTKHRQHRGHSGRGLPPVQFRTPNHRHNIADFA